MAQHTISQEQELINYANEIGFGSLPYKVSETISKIRKVFADTITNDIDRPYNEQMKDLLKACEENGIEFVNGDVFGDMDDTGVLRIEETYQHPTENYCLGVLVDVLIGLQLHNNNEADTEENTFIACTHYVDVIIDDDNTHEEIEIQDINGNTLACLLKGSDVKLQVNTVEVPETAKTFVYDGCHKLYVIISEEERAEAKRIGYDTEIPISELEQYYINSCPLRFIESIGVGDNESMMSILPQGTDCPMFIYY